MTNYERYKNEIEKITRMGRMVAVEEKTGKIISCGEITCSQCKFHSCNEESCGIIALAWADAEYVEPEEKEIDWTRVPVDTPILVRDSMQSDWIKRHFAKYEHNFVYAWCDGKTSYTTDSMNYWSYWNYGKLAEVE